MADDSTPNVKPPTLRQRRLGIVSNVLVQLVLALALVVGVNWLASRHYLRFDWTKSGYNKLSEKTRQTLHSLTNTVNVIVFIPPRDEREYVEKTLQDVRNVLHEFEYTAKGKLHVEFVDPQRDLARAKQLVEQYKLDAPDVIIFSHGERHKYVKLDDIVELEQTQFGQGGRVRAFKGEGEFLAAIETVLEEKPLKVYFIAGHGEHNPESTDQRTGFAELARYIRRDNLNVEKWNLQEKQALPDDAAALIIAGPHKPFTEAELTALENYFKNKGRLFIMVDPRMPTGLDAFLNRWGVQVDNNLVMAKAGALLGTDLLMVDAMGGEYAAHPITKSLREQEINTSFPYTRSVRRLDKPPGTPDADQQRVTELIKTPAGFWGETDLETEAAKFNPAVDLKGPLSLAVAVEVGKPRGVDVDLGLSRMVVVGTSGFVDNIHVAQGGGNLDFFMNSLNWLLQREHLVAVAPKAPEEFSLSMTPGQVHAVYAMVIGGLPLTVAFIGFMVWWGRRK